MVSRILNRKLVLTAFGVFIGVSSLSWLQPANGAPEKSGDGEDRRDTKGASVQSKVNKSTSILHAAEESVGKQMWKGFGLADGSLGCAASLSNVLALAGVKYARAPLTKVVRHKLVNGPIKASEHVIKAGGDGPIDDATVSKVARPGDVLVAFMDPLPRGSVGPKAHCGIIGPNATVFTNDWNDGIWKHASIHTYFDSYRHISVIRLQ
ncbi:MAG: hypothetical protein K2X93_17545 [Candidatus Obscuribacterales bacterium]|nr:hypothetical protein [Candidatus Obscuribacterales bacterium]